MYENKLKMSEFFSWEKSPDLVNSANLYVCDNFR